MSRPALFVAGSTPIHQGENAMKEILKALAIHSRLFARCLAIAMYITGFQDVRKLLEAFAGAGKRLDRRSVRRLTLDIYFSELHYQISPEEYFLYQFEGKSGKERHAYIGCGEKNKLCAEIGDEKSRQTLANKYECYLFFKEFFGRDVIKVSGREDRAAFEAFLSKHRDFIVKPIDQSGGAGVYRMAADDTNIDGCFQKVLDSGPCVVEQCIEQVDEMAQFHPQSVNTIRIGTFYNAGGTKILFSIFRAGTGGAVVDNTAAGGIFASVNIANGKIQSDGYTMNRKIYQTHPDTGCVFHGFQIPYWKELLDVVVKAVQTFPQQNYICWDFALTNSGWVIIEANSRGEFEAYQVFFGGIRELFMKEFHEYKNYRGLKK